MHSVIRSVLTLPLLLAGLMSMAQPCDCRKNFDNLVNTVSANYAGFSDKVYKATQHDFKALTTTLRRKAIAANQTDSCYVILRTWTNFFKDRHLRIQLDWRYRQENPDGVKRLNALLSNSAKGPALPETIATQTSITQLSTSTLLIRLPSFEWNEKGIIDSLIKANHRLLSATPNWIIDVRNNSGGTDYAFSNLLPFVYTTPVKTYPDEFRSSKGNISILEENLKNDEIAASAKEFTSRLIRLMKEKPKGFVNPYGKKYFESALDTVYQYPKKVAILINRNSASSTESFLLTVRQSSKVRVYGENSAGVLDYANANFFDFPDKNFNLVIPISRSSRLPDHPIDNIGITPDVKIAPSIADKVAFIQQQLEQAGR